MDTLILSYLIGWKEVIYLLIFIGLLFEGEAVIFTSIYLAQAGYIYLPQVLFIIILGVLLGDMLWYKLGTKIDKLPAFLQKIFCFIAAPMDCHILSRTTLTFFILKFTYGFNHPSLLRAGVIKLPFRKFIKANILSSLSWILIIALAAYFSSASLSHLKHYFRYMEIGLAASLIIFITASHFLMKKIKVKL